MRQLAGKRYWLIGASEGLGRATAKALADVGCEVIVSARNQDRLNELCAEIGERCQAVPLDVSDANSVADAAEAAGEIDGLVYLAGLYWPMEAQDWDADSVTAMCDVNFTGAARVIGAALPAMMARNRGHVVLTGSLSGFRGLPGSIGYGASKAGVMYLAESMYADLHDTGIDVQLVNPGFVRTRLTDKNNFTMPFIMEPEEAASRVVRHMKTRRFKASFPSGFSLVFRGSQFLPDWLYYRFFS